MSILAELNSLLVPVLPVETGVFSDIAPEAYLVLTPLWDSFQLFADNKPQLDVAELRISLFSKGNYRAFKKQITSLLLEAEFTISERMYIGYEEDTGYHHYAIDVAKAYEMEG